MLVKLGIAWVDPTQIIFIMPMRDSVSVSIKDDGYHGAISVCDAESLDNAIQISDEYSKIINNALIQHSFGNGNETETPYS